MYDLFASVNIYLPGLIWLKSNDWNHWFKSRFKSTI